MIAGVHPEVVLAAGYAALLAIIAALLEIAARHAHRRAQRYETVGFTYRPEHDRWECPTAQPLLRVGTDHVRRVVRYRAPAHACNACRIKGDCTDSDEGRLLEQRLDSWIESELRRFHRGLSITLLALATLILSAETFRHDRPRELLIAAALWIPLVIAATRLSGSLFARERRPDTRRT